MIRQCTLVETDSVNPHYNLALEHYLLDNVNDDECILYLWQNQNTVVIGRNQNAWKECRTALLREEGGTLARRLSGGGAVFHDLGNLNFTFLMPTSEYDERRQEQVILEALLSFGLDAEISGRNDLTVQGKKVSGNAYYHNRGRSYHHGTLLVDVDKERMGRYLNPSKAKLRGKGVDSVRSRVMNLKEMEPSITIDVLKEALTGSFADLYRNGRIPLRRLDPNALDQSVLSNYYEQQKSWSWNYGRNLPFDLSVEERFPWGELRVEFSIGEGIIRNVSAWTDSMDWDLSEKLEKVLIGCRFHKEEMLGRIKSADLSNKEDIIRILMNTEL